MPGRPGHNTDGPVRQTVAVDQGNCLVEYISLDRAALRIQHVQPARNHRSLVRVFRRQKFCPEAGCSDPAAGIDAGPKQETGVIGRWRALHPRDSTQSLQAAILPLPHDAQALRYKGPIDAAQRHNVTHRAKSHEVQQSRKIGFRAGI